MANVFCTGVYTSVLYIAIHIYTSILGGGWEVNAAPHPRFYSVHTEGPEATAPRAEHSLPWPHPSLVSDTYRHLVTACAAPVLLPAPYQCHEGRGASWPPAHIPSRCLTAATTALGQQWSQRWPSSYGLLLPWGLASLLAVVIHRGSGMESPEPVLGQRWESCVNFLK